ncbi:MAG: T9SS type A sorting domain-containing protein [Bacteroidales bacterium]|nr:T9SS type A sorting domain-containing protein [Bacteroidales bacterium]
MKNIFTTMALCLVCAFGAFAQNYSTVQITPVNGVLTVNGVDQITIPNYDPSEVQLEPMAGFVAVPSADQMYTVAEYATLDAVWNACNSSAIWADNLVTLDTYSGEGMNTGYAALKFSGTPNTYGYAKFDKSVSGGWTEFGYFTTGNGVAERTNTISVYPNPVVETIRINNAEEAHVAIYDMKGQQVKLVEYANANTMINVSDLSSGVYFVKVTSGSKVNTVKFVKE